MKPTYIGVGEAKMCAECGVDVRNTTRHDSHHIAVLAELDRLRRENLALSVKVEKLEREARHTQLVGV
jgi:hypothetical protein